MEGSLSFGMIKGQMARKLTLIVGVSFTEVNWAFGMGYATYDQRLKAMTATQEMFWWQEEGEVIL